MIHRLLALLLLACAIPAQAQTVRGRVTEAETQRPIAGAFVVLLDASGASVAGTLTGPDGQFEHRAPAAGAYRLRVERIGVQTVTSAPITLDAGAVVPYEMRVATQIVLLEPITAEAGSRCTVRPSGGVALHQVWEEARKALALAAWTQAQGGVPFTTLLYDRTRELVSLRIKEETRQMRSGYDRQTFFSAPAEQLAARGYVRDDGQGSHLYFGLDAPTLLSDPFLNTHCFRIVDAPRDRPELAGLLGLHFEPVRGHPHPDIQGVLWLDRRTSRLRLLEFQYTRHLQPWPVPMERFGGRVEFTRLENGAWIVERWWLRMPQFAAGAAGRPVMLGGRMIRPDDLRTLNGRELASAADQIGLTVREAGGDVLLVHDAGRIGPAASGMAVLEGVVVDSARGTPLAGATVYVAGTHRATRTDAAGRFRFASLPEGPQRVSFFHPRTDSLLLVMRLREVTLASGAPTTVTLGVPREGQCAGLGQPRHAAMVGQVRNADADSAVHNAQVWATFVQAAARRARGSSQPLETRSDAAGRYLLCDVPVNAELEIRAAAPFLRVERVQKRFEDGLHHHDFTLSARP